jgi:carboxynorspermidine decarboxylase
MGDWSFDAPLRTGDSLIFEDMIHYTTVKTTMFNGITHPAIAIRTQSGKLKLLRTYTYRDYRNRMD